MDFTLRKTYRKQLTTLIKEVEGLLAKENEDIEEIPVLISRVKAIHDNLKIINEKVAPLLQENQLEKECEKIVEYEDNAVKIIAKLELRLSHQTKRNNADPVNENTVFDMQPHQVQEDNMAGRSGHSRVRLPKLDILKFDGDIANWPAFWEQYNLAIHENSELDNAAKFAYLKSYLTGKALITINGLTSSQSSYNDAIEMLKSEYADTERIVDMYIQKLLAIAPVKFEKDTQGLKKLYNTASTITRSLTTLGISPIQYALLVKSIIFKALPYNMRIAFNKHKINDNDLNATSSNVGTELNSTDDNVDYNKQITSLLKYIKVELDSIEQARCSNEWDNKPKFASSHADKFKNKQFTAAGLLTSVKDCCLFCQSNVHQTKDCNSTLDINEKKNILKQNKLCFRCIKPNHNSRNCRTSGLKCEKCKYRHVTSMCDPNYRKPQQTVAVSNKPNVDNRSTNLLTNGSIDNVYLKTACAYLITNDTQKMTLIRMVIDGGSQLTFVKESLSRKLGLPVTGTHKIAIQSFGKDARAPARLCNRVKVVLKGQYTDDLIEINAIEVPEICFDSLETPCLKDPVIEEFSRGHQLADIRQTQQSVNGISLLIGADNYWKLITGETRRLTKDLTAVNSKFGWTLLGSSGNNTYDFMVNLNLVTVLKVQAVSEDFNVKDFWNLETIGINLNETDNNQFTNDYVREKIVFKNGRYEVSLPWKREQLLDSNYSGALTRVKYLTNKLLRDGKLIDYDAAIREYIKNDCAETVSNNSGGVKIYYMPHRPVYREDKDTTKLRVVYDASAHGPSFESLNEQLFVGANLVPDLVKILLKFRIGSIGIIADIEKAFLQIVLNERDRDSHRFLWYSKPINKNISSSAELPDLTTYRMKRVTFGVTTSPFLLAATLKKHLTNQPARLNETANILEESFYVDDLVVAINNVEEALKLYAQSKEIFETANMNLRKWCSNDLELNTIFKEKEEAFAENEPKKVLGVVWHTVTDEISIDVSHVINTNNKDRPTKRSVLQTIAKIFDPLGMLGAYTVKMKILLQSLWKENLGWDEHLPETLEKEWNKWYADLPLLSDFQMSRIALHNSNNDVELHVFADASPQAYGTVAYLKCLTTNSSKFLIAKNRVAPLNKKGIKQLTLPKLELTAALCAARLQSYILKNLKINVKEVFMWSDSKITLYWIQRDTRKKEIYVKNRVDEIRSLTKGTWRYCPSKENPADLLTRGESAKNLKESKIWQEGPEWLQKDPQNWPTNDIEDIKVEYLNVALVNVSVMSNDRKSNKEPIFSLDKYEKLEKILAITAYILRFKHNCQTKEKILGPLKANELKGAEDYWLKYVQQTAFLNEIEALSKSAKINSRSTILTLSPFLDDDGIMRLGGRLQEACLPFETRHPIILPQSSYTRKLIVRCHDKVMHSGVNATLNELRKKYWVVRSRQQVKTITSRCLKCRKLKSKPGSEPFAPLPMARLTMANPFKFTGVDFAGPLYVTNTEKSAKVYVMILTCAVVRAIHLELVPDLTTESCIRAMRKFIARRGVPNIIYSDNAKTFRRTSLEVQLLFRILASETFQDKMRKHRIEWRFIVERAAWWGGFWERLVRTVKDALKITLRRFRVNYDELSTILTEAEATINSRPLTFIDDDPTNLLILTPAHFLIGSNECGFSIDLKNPEIRRNDILLLWKNRELKSTKIWQRWCTDYLQQLRSAHHTPNVKSRELKRGDVVLLHDQNLPRLQWKLVRILDLFQGRDGKTRACEVQASNGSKMRRPVQLLYPLEVDHFRPGEDVENSEDAPVTAAQSER